MLFLIRDLLSRIVEFFRGKDNINNASIIPIKHLGIIDNTFKEEIV